MAPHYTLMPPSITPARAALDMLQCMGLGLILSTIRCLFPRRHVVGFLADFFAVGAALVLVQSYAACRSGAGTMRWYLLAGAALGAAAGEWMLWPLRQAVCRYLMRLLRAVMRLMLFPVKFLRHTLLRLLFCLRTHRSQKAQACAAQKKHGKRHKKRLQKQSELLYNSNV